MPTGTLYQADLKGPVALVLGAEGAGMRQLTRQDLRRTGAASRCAAVESLNVSVASGVCLYEALRQRAQALKPRPASIQAMPNCQCNWR
jgi:23S rRNA (guanosine2251-2'-O)-methyltransferase